MIAVIGRWAWLVLAAAACPTATLAQALLRVDGTAFVLTLPDGRMLHGPELRGATLRISTGGRVVPVTIQEVEDDPHAVGGRVLLHRFVVRDNSGRAMDLCAPDVQGLSFGFPVPDEHGGFELTCTSGAVGKCIRWGYRPWEERPGGPPLRALHQACLHMTRAVYSGAGEATTRDGTLIDLYDRFGIQTPDPAVPMTFEAAWGVEGAICVARPRIPEIASLEDIGRRSPRLIGHLGPEACTEERAMRDPRALLFNRSGP